MKTAKISINIQKTLFPFLLPRRNGLQRPRPPHCQDSWSHSIWHNTFGRTPLDEWSGRRTDLYSIIHNSHNRQISMPPAGFEPTIPASDRPQTHALDRAASGIGSRFHCCHRFQDNSTILKNRAVLSSDQQCYYRQKFECLWQYFCYHYQGLICLCYCVVGRLISDGSDTKRFSWVQERCTQVWTQHINSWRFQSFEPNEVKRKVFKVSPQREFYRTKSFLRCR